MFSKQSSEKSGAPTKEVNQPVALTRVMSASSAELHRLAIDVLTRCEWMSKQMNGDINKSVAEARVQQQKTRAQMTAPLNSCHLSQSFGTSVGAHST